MNQTSLFGPRHVFEDLTFTIGFLIIMNRVHLYVKILMKAL